jgi:hypothetical protein
VPLLGPGKVDSSSIALQEIHRLGPTACHPLKTRTEQTTTRFLRGLFFGIAIAIEISGVLPAPATPLPPQKNETSYKNRSRSLAVGTVQLSSRPHIRYRHRATSL